MAEEITMKVKRKALYLTAEKIKGTDSFVVTDELLSIKVYTREQFLSVFDIVEGTLPPKEEGDVNDGTFDTTPAPEVSYVTDESTQTPDTTVYGD